MSRAPHLVDGRANQLRYGNAELRDSLVVDGLWCAFENWAMGNAAEFIADEYEVTREAMDRYATGSHQKAIAAIDSGKFDAEIVPVMFRNRKGEEVRFQATMEDGETIIAKQVVVALGFKHFKNEPQDLVEGLPAGRFSHTCDLVDFRPLKGKRCLILGGRHSAYE